MKPLKRRPRIRHLGDKGAAELQEPLALHELRRTLDLMEKMGLSQYQRTVWMDNGGYIFTKSYFNQDYVEIYEPLLGEAFEPLENILKLQLTFTGEKVFLNEEDGRYLLGSLWLITNQGKEIYAYRHGRMQDDALVPEYEDETKKEIITLNLAGLATDQPYWVFYEVIDTHYQDENGDHPAVSFLTQAAGPEGPGFHDPANWFGYQATQPAGKIIVDDVKPGVFPLYVLSNMSVDGEPITLQDGLTIQVFAKETFDKSDFSEDFFKRAVPVEAAADDAGYERLLLADLSPVRPEDAHDILYAPDLGFDPTAELVIVLSHGEGGTNTSHPPRAERKVWVVTGEAMVPSAPSAEDHDLYFSSLSQAKVSKLKDKDVYKNLEYKVLETQLYWTFYDLQVFFVVYGENRQPIYTWIFEPDANDTPTLLNNMTDYIELDQINMHCHVDERGLWFWAFGCYSLPGQAPDVCICEGDIPDGFRLIDSLGQGWNPGSLAGSAALFKLSHLHKPIDVSITLQPWAVDATQNQCGTVKSMSVAFLIKAASGDYPGEIYGPGAFWKQQVNPFEDVFSCDKPSLTGGLLLPYLPEVCKGFSVAQVVQGGPDNQDWKVGHYGGQTSLQTAYERGVECFGRNAYGCYTVNWTRFAERDCRKNMDKLMWGSIFKPLQNIKNGVSALGITQRTMPMYPIDPEPDAPTRYGNTWCFCGGAPLSGEEGLEYNEDCISEIGHGTDTAYEDPMDLAHCYNAVLNYDCEICPELLVQCQDAIDLTVEGQCGDTIQHGFPNEGGQGVGLSGPDALQQGESAYLTDSVCNQGSISIERMPSGRYDYCPGWLRHISTDPDLGYLVEMDEDAGGAYKVTVDYCGETSELIIRCSDNGKWVLQGSYCGFPGDTNDDHCSKTGSDCAECILGDKKQEACWGVQGTIDISHDRNWGDVCPVNICDVPTSECENNPEAYPDCCCMHGLFSEDESTQDLCYCAIENDSTYYHNSCIDGWDVGSYDPWTYCYYGATTYDKIVKAKECLCGWGYNYYLWECP